MESLSLSRSVVNNLNHAFDNHAKVNRHLQTGKRVMHSSDDAGEASKLGKVKMDLIKNRNIQHNLQNSLSLLQAQDGMFKAIGNILDRSAEIKIKSESPIANATDKAAYDKEFDELQRELRSIATSKWNGVSLFSTQNSKTLFGPAVDTEDLNQESNDQATDAPLQLSRWGVYQFTPDESTKSLNKKLLAITITDESEGDPSAFLKPYRGTDPAENLEGRDLFDGEKTDWQNFISSLGITAEIGVVVAESVSTSETGASIDTDGGEVVPDDVDETSDLTGFAKVYRGMGREAFTLDQNSFLNSIGWDENGRDRTPVMTNSSAQANFLWDKFQEMTNNGTELPDALGIFVDNSGSLFFNEINQALFQFVDNVRTTYPSIILPSDDLIAGDPTVVDTTADPEGDSINFQETGIFRGISLAGKENWIKQSENALRSLIQNDASFQAALEPDEEDPTYSLSTYSQSDFEGFMNTLIEARGQNAAEQQRILGEIAELSEKVVNLEKSIETGESLDFAAAMGVFHKTKDQVDLNAQLVAAAKDMENVLFTDFL